MSGARFHLALGFLLACGTTLANKTRIEASGIKKDKNIGYERE